MSLLCQKFPKRIIPRAANFSAREAVGWVVLSVDGLPLVEAFQGIAAMRLDQLGPNVIIKGPIFPEPVRIIMAGLLLKELKIRGLVQRTLIVTPANLTFQWQRELQDKFHEKFEVIRGSVLRANYGQNPWQDRNQVITSISWVSRIEEAKDSLLRSHWDLIIVDEAHKMSAYNAEKKTLAYQLGELLSEKTDHYLLMTATPHKACASS